jgi:AraC-like DNA-binding protein
MVRFEQLLQNGQGINASISEICATLQVSERRLRSLCAGHLGMSPTAYDSLRRMSLVRRALLCADSVAEKVSVVARQNGFRDLGRFAVNYRAAFGEPPSTTCFAEADYQRCATSERLARSGKPLLL